MNYQRNYASGQPQDVAAEIELLTIKEAAEFLKVPVSMVRRLQYGRYVPFIKVGGAIRFNKHDIVEYLRKSTIDSMH
jgi:excisionase family DNA binding protein